MCRTGDVKDGSARTPLHEGAADLHHVGTFKRLLRFCVLQCKPTPDRQWWTRVDEKEPVTQCMSSSDAAVRCVAGG